MALARWLVAIVMCAFMATVAQASESVWDALRAPGSVVVLRHSFAPGGFDPPDAKLDDCSTQRNLDERGRVQAQRIGDAFRQNGDRGRRGAVEPALPMPGHSPPGLRAGAAVGVLQGALNDAERRQRQLAEIRKAIAAHRSGPPLVLVTHGSVVTDLTGLNIRMGEFVVLRRVPDGSHAVAGQLYVD